MNTKRWAFAALFGLLMLRAGPPPVWAQSNDPDAASLTITITPNADFGVSIDTQNVVMDLGSVDLYGTTQTVSPATVTILGTVNSDGSETTGQELLLNLLFDSVGAVWDIDTTPSTDSTSGALDELAVYALFSDTGLSVAPNGNDFANDFGGFTSGILQTAGGENTNGVLFEKTGHGAKNMDHQSVGDQAHLWMLFRLPDQTTSGDPQTLTLTANAVAAN